MLRFFLPAIFLLSGCALFVGESLPAKAPVQNLNPAPTQPSPAIVSTARQPAKIDGAYDFPTLYWANRRAITETDWYAVYGGTIVEVKKEKEKLGGDFARKFTKGKLKVEKIFLNLPEKNDISIGSLISSESFDGLKTGDKFIVFINVFYEGSYCRVDIDGTDSPLGLKVENWNEPFVSALEKVASCDKITEETAEGHPKNVKFKNHDCLQERNRLILDDPQISEIWKRFDPKGFQLLVERRKFENTEQ